MPKGKILAVDDDSDLLQILKGDLKREGYRVVTAPSGEAGLKAARRHRPDLILLDINLPGMDGADLCRRLRAETRVPIVFLSGRTGELDRVLGFKLGADDYVVKPFSSPELMERIKAILSRARPGPPRASPPRRLGAAELDLERREVRVRGRVRDLAPKEFQILAELLKAEGNVLSREDLLRLVWNYDDDMDIDTRTVDQHVVRLRRKLGAEGSRVATVKGFGYKLRLG